MQGRIGVIKNSSAIRVGPNISSFCSGCWLSERRVTSRFSPTRGTWKGKRCPNSPSAAEIPFRRQFAFCFKTLATHTPSPASVPYVIRPSATARTLRSFIVQSLQLAASSAKPRPALRPIVQRGRVEVRAIGPDQRADFLWQKRKGGRK
jgi:hypothetical protein